MKTSMVVTVVGPDRPGIVEALSRVALSHEANWEGSRMIRLAGRFAGVAQLTVDEQRAESLASELRQLGSEGLQIVVDRGHDDTGERPRASALRLELVGNDRPGILREISRALASRNVNVEELDTSCLSAPMTGDTLFKMAATLRCAQGADVDELRGVLEALGNDLMVDVRVVVPKG